MCRATLRKWLRGACLRQGLRRVARIDGKPASRSMGLRDSQAFLSYALVSPPW
ncbi:hypothetical protein MCHLDSM_07049 [Mycolicibacterium chlorophenolicum]|uniref:Uncharacterized protein n=1 Tax=Mycolicibacterium chlorophenolicum TaxID=37916 RepID=A0A0J6Y3S2_9MYCO|nr:hypothetical protein MCHLDSM_07049 [Mycolicibacterium chlorophenolicum]